MLSCHVSGSYYENPRFKRGKPGPLDPHYMRAPNEKFVIRELMAQLERKKYGDRFTGDQLLPVSGVESEVHGQWRGQSLSRTNSGEDEHHHKKSVLAKVKDKAKKWRSTLSKKKHNGQDHNTPAWGVSLQDYEEDVEDPEYHGAPMYESDMAHSFKEASNRPHTPTPTPNMVTPTIETPQHHQIMDSTTITQEDNNNNNNNNKTLAETVTEMLAPAYTMVTEATNMITTKIQGPKGDGEHVWDKGVSVKEYLRHKLEPGEEERALSRVISEVMSPRAQPEMGDKDRGVIEKVRGVVSSLLRMEQQPPSIPVSTNHPTTDVHATITTTTTNTHIPSSKDPFEEIEEAKEVRHVQIN